MWSENDNAPVYGGIQPKKKALFILNFYKSQSGPGTIF